MKNDAKNEYLEQLFLRFRDGGDMRALAKLFDAAAPQLMPVAIHLAARRDEADDLVQATFLSAIERAASYEGGRPLLPWLLGILALHARKLREKQGRMLDAERMHQPSTDDPERIAAAREAKFAVDAACRELPVAYATIVQRHLVDGLQPSELATELGLSSGAARVRLHRGLKLLRRALPAAFASGAYAMNKSRGIAAIRETVLQHASLLTGSPVPAAGFAPLAILLACLAPLCVAVPIWFATRANDSSELASAAAPLPTTSAAVAPAAGPTSVSNTGRVDTFVEASSPSSPNSPSGALMSNAIVRGRLVWPDGTAVSDASVEFNGSSAGDERVQQSGLPADWHDPATVHTNADGLFEFSFDPPGAYQFTMRATGPSASSARWCWNELAPGSTLDLGDVTIEHAASVLVRVVDVQGQVLCSGWSVSAEGPSPSLDNGRQEAWRQTQCTAANGEMLLDALPPHAVEVQASCKAGIVLDKKLVELTEGSTQHVDLVYAGPDLARRITIDATVFRWFRDLDAPTTEIRVSKPGMAPRLAVLAPQRASDYVVDDLDPGAYDVEIVDARLVPWSKSGVQSGEIVRAKLSGNAGVRLHIVGADGSAYTGHYAASFGYLNVNFSPNSFTLLRQDEQPPVGNTFTGFVPHDLVLKIAAAGGASHEFQVLGLAPNEVRDVTCALYDGITLAGRVVAADGTTPLAGVDVQLTRGDRPGHTLGANATVWKDQERIPAIDARAATNPSGDFHFDGLAAGHWTLRAAWGSYLCLDTTFDVAASTPPITLVQPANGGIAGHLLVPEGAPIADASILPRLASGTLTPTNGGAMPPAAELLADGSFHVGPLPVGDIQLGLQVRTPSAFGGFETHSSVALGTFAVVAGQETPVEVDVRQTFPGRVRAHVTIDGVAASEGFFACTQDAGPSFGSGNEIGLDGISYAGSLSPGSAWITITSRDELWSWPLAQPVDVQPGQETQLEIPISTTARDLRCVDATTGAALASTAIELRTGPAGREHTATRTTDAEGILHLQMPEQNVELRRSGNTGSFTTIAWSAGNGPLSVALH
jgi:RNA polymerase sigma-70 factor (ECF subfamily)